MDSKNVPNDGLQVADVAIFGEEDRHEHQATLMEMDVKQCQPPDSSRERLELRRELGLFSAVSNLLSTMIGAGIFVSPSSALLRAGSVGEALLVWVACGVISFLGALVFAELASVVPKSGAEYSFFQAAYLPLHKFWGPLPSFTFTWVNVLILRPAETAVITLVFAEYLYQTFVPYISDHHQDLITSIIAILSLGLGTFINIKSVKLFVKIQNIFSSLKILVCLIVIFGGVYNLSTGHLENINRGFEGSKTGYKDITLAVYSGLWTLDGWASVVEVSEEIKNPNKNILRSILIVLPLVTALFTMMNVAYMSALTVQEMVSVPAVAVAFGDRVLGPVKIIIPIGVALASFSCSLSFQFGAARLAFAAAREGHMPECLSYIHVHHYTPAPAVLLQGILTLIFILCGDITRLIEFATFLIWIFYGLAFAALLVLRNTKPEAVRSYKVSLVVPVFMVVLAVVLVVVPLADEPAIEHIGALVFIVLGLFVYYPFVYCQYRLPCLDNIIHLVQVMMKADPPSEDVPET